MIPTTLLPSAQSLKMQAPPASEEASTPDKPVSGSRKRKRNVLSCLDCRRRKVKCDRGWPVCTRCLRGGLEATCTYQSLKGSANGADEDEFSVDDERPPEKRRMADSGVNGSLSTSQQPQEASFRGTVPTTTKNPNQLSGLKSRIMNLERIVAQDLGPQRAPKSVSSVEAAARAEDDLKEPETNFYKGRDFRTQFYGASHPTSILAHFPELPVLLKNMRHDTRFRGMIYESQALEKMFEEEKTKIANSHPREPSLLELVPERRKTDHFVKLYFDTFETTYRLIHRPTFFKSYEQFWQAPQACPLRFLALLLSLMATVRCASPDQNLQIDSGALARDEAVRWIHACDAWMKEQSQKHRFLEMYQVACLRIIAAQACSLKVKQAYEQVEALLNYCKAAGFHRDPVILGTKCSIFDAEMRRRIWATVREFELQASIDRGTTSALSAFPTDCKPPLNVNDEAIMPETLPGRLPESRLSTHFTHTSYLDVASQSISLRVSLCAFVNDFTIKPSHDDVLEYEKQIQDALDTIPKWTDPASRQVSTLLDVQLRQFLLFIHSPFARRNQSSRDRYSRMVCFETSKHILDQASSLIDFGNWSLALSREDIYRAALSFCHNAFLSSLEPKNFISSGVLASFSHIIEDTFKKFAGIALRRGVTIKSFWYLSVAHTLVQMKLQPQNADSLRVQPMERVAVLYRQIMAPFKHNPPLPSVSAQLSLEAPGRGNWAYNVPLAPLPALEYPQNGVPMQMPDAELFDASDWMLDGLWPMDGNFDMMSMS